MSSRSRITTIRNNRLGSRAVELDAREMKRFRSVVLPGAKRGDLPELQYVVEGLRKFKELALPEVVDVLLGHLDGSKVPSIETLPASFARGREQFHNQTVERAFLGVKGVGHISALKDTITSDPLIRDRLKAGWPGILAWLCYFYVGCFEMGLGDSRFRDDVERRLNFAFFFAGNSDDITLAIKETAGTVRLATLLYLLESSKGSRSIEENQYMGTTTLVTLLQVGGYDRAFDEIVEATHGHADVIVDKALGRLNNALDSPDGSLRGVIGQLWILMLIADAPKQHPLWLAIGPRKPIGIAMNTFHRLLEIPFTTNRMTSPDMNLQNCISLCVHEIFGLMKKDRTGKNCTLQALEAGLLTALITCAPLTFSFTKFDRRDVVNVLEHLALLSSDITIVRQESAELERLESEMTVQGRINGAAPDVRDALKGLYETICARREILAQMQNFNSTPMSCDNCYKFDERANFKKCAGCQRAHYCSKDCQARAWKEKGHKAECKSLKSRPVTSKTKHRMLNQEKYFLARCVVNEAQQKKEQLNLMASVGLNYVAVEAYYNMVPPRYLISCDVTELGSQIQAATREFSRLSDTSPSTERYFRDSTSSDPVNSPSTESQETRLQHAAEGAGSRIQLNEDGGATSINSNAPPVHLWVHLPSIGQDPSRTEHFVVDDFWDFAQIKFDDLDFETNGIEHQEALSSSGYDKTHSLGKVGPSVQALMDKQRTRDAEKIDINTTNDFLAKSLEDGIMGQVMNLWGIKKAIHQHVQSGIQEPPDETNQSIIDS